MTTSDLIRVSARPDPFTSENIRIEVPEGTTLSEILETVQPDPAFRAYGHIWLGAEKIDRQYWDVVRPKSGTNITIRLALGNSGGDDGSKNIFRTILTIAVIVVATYVSFGTATVGLLGATGAQLAGAAVPIGGMMVVNQ